jgi:hypothetical protein
MRLPSLADIGRPLQNANVRDPLIPFARWANSVTRRWGIFAGDKVVALVTLPIFGAFWGGLSLAMKAVAPNTGITRWMTANWSIMAAGTCILLAIYLFVRNFFDAKTGT